MSPLTHSTNVAARMGRWSARHRKIAIFGWLAFVVLSLVAGNLVGTKSLQWHDTGSGETARAEKILGAGGFHDVGAAETILIQSERLTVRDAAFRAAIEDAVRAVSAAEGVESVRSPLDPENAAQVSADGRSAIVQFAIRGDLASTKHAVTPIVDAVAAVDDAYALVSVAQFGDASAGKALDDTIGKDFKRAELTAIPVTLAILLLAFGSLLAAGIPLLLALSAVAAAIGLLALPSQLLPVDSAASSVILLIGLAVGVDYSLFYLRREREERAAGRGAEAALEAAAATSGRAVLISGLTVVVAMAGLFLTGNAVFSSIGLGTILVVAIAVAGSLTVLPALLSKLGPRVDRGRLPFLHRLQRPDGESRFWGFVLGAVLRRPLLAAAVSGGALVALTVPAFGLHTALPGLNTLPRSLEVMQTYDRLQEAFPGGPLPAVVAVRADDVTAPAVQEAIADLRREAVATGRMQEPIHVEVSADKRVARVLVPMDGQGTDAVANAALAALRGEVVPATVGALDGVEVAVTGVAAGSKDFNDAMKSRAPIVFAFVLALAFALLLAAFRSVVIALKAIVLNLLSVGAAYGLLVLVFQHGFGESLLGFESIGGIVSWLPLFLFVVLFGLSMDYHVFILSRVREAYDRGMSTEDAVAHGIKTTAGVVTSAALVMVAVFSVFATLSTIEMKQLGVGLAAAILIDATIVRAVLLPATMKLLGRWNWYLPRWLEWLPRMEHEPSAGAPAGVAEPAAA